MIKIITVTCFFLCVLFARSLYSKQSDKKPRVYLTLSVDWEGDTLQEQNLKRMISFAQKYPEIPIVHFLNAAYYTKKRAGSDDEISAMMASVLKSNDEIGIHIHPWKRFVEAAGVAFRQGPTYFNLPISPGRNGENGDDVPLNSYTTDEIKKLVRFSIDKLNEQGFANINSFRAGGWMSGPKVFEALMAEGVGIDSSAVPVKFVGQLYPDTGLYRLNKQLWHNVTDTSSPYRINTESGKLLQFPNNSGLADYVDENGFFDVYLKNLEHAHKTKKPVYLHFGFHQETAHLYLDRVDRGLQLLFAHAKKSNVEIVPRTLEQSARKSFKAPMLMSKVKCINSLGAIVL